MDLAQKDYDLRTGQLSDAEKEQENAAKENRDPVLPASFIIPQRVSWEGLEIFENHKLGGGHNELGWVKKSDEKVRIHPKSA